MLCKGVFQSDFMMLFSCSITTAIAVALLWMCIRKRANIPSASPRDLPKNDQDQRAHTSAAFLKECRIEL